MDYSTIINVIGTVALPILAYVLSRLSALQKDLDAHRLHVAEQYLKKDDFNGFLQKIEKNIEKIFEKLDTLAERRHAQRDSE